MFKKTNSYYQKQKKFIKKILDIDKNYNYRFNETVNRINIIDDENKVLFTAEYDIAGVYATIPSVWYWAWNIEFIDRKLAENSKIVKKFGKTLLDKKNISPIELEQLHYITSNGNFYVSKDTIMECIKLILYLTKGIWFFPLCHGEKNIICNNNSQDKFKRIEYIIIRKIL